MPFKPGISGNPLGRPRGGRRWLSERDRVVEAQKTFHRLIEVRDGMVLERKEIKGPDGELITVDVVPSMKDLISCCKEILNRAIGLPRAEGEMMDGQVDKGVLFIDFMRSLIFYLSSRDQAALEHLEFHIRGFAAEMKLDGPITLPIDARRCERRELNSSKPAHSVRS